MDNILRTTKGVTYYVQGDVIFAYGRVSFITTKGVVVVLKADDVVRIGPR